jgi:hypothetical protein
MYASTLSGDVSVEDQSQPKFSWMNPKLEIRKTGKYGSMVVRAKEAGRPEGYSFVPGEGYGVFARDEIEKDEVLFVMGGYILTIADENALADGISDKPIEISEHFSIGPRSGEDIARMPQHYVNHSCDPNAGFDGQIFMLAMQPICEGEEIVYDYAMIMHPSPASDSYFSFECMCGGGRVAVR